MNGNVGCRMIARSPRSVMALRNLRAVRSPLSQRLRSTETVSTSTRSGAARSRSARSTARAVAPSSPSSPRALATIEASATITDHVRSSDRSATAWSNPTLPPRRRSIRSSTSSRVGCSASRLSSVTRYCCSDCPWLSARRCSWVCTSAGRSLTSTFGMLALCYHQPPVARPLPLLGVRDQSSADICAFASGLHGALPSLGQHIRQCSPPRTSSEDIGRDGRLGVQCWFSRQRLLL